MATEPQQPDLSGMEPVETKTPSPAFVPQPSYPPAPNPFERSPLPPSQVMQPDTLRSFFRPGGPPQSRVSPQPPNATPAIGATSASQAVTVIQQGQGTLLETNNVPNADQTTLNLRAGANISLVADKFGGVTVNGTATGDGIDHGDSIWGIDPGYVLLRDDFFAAGSNSGTPSNFGQLQWDGNARASNLFTGSGFGPNLGVFSVSKPGSTNDWQYLMLTPGVVTGPQGSMPLLDDPSWRIVWIFCFSNENPQASAFTMANTSFYLGLASTPHGSGIWTPASVSGGTPRPPFFVGLRYDTDTTSPAISDTTFHFEAVSNPNFTSTATRNNAQGVTFNTGVTPVQGQWYQFEILCTAAGIVQMKLTPGSTTYQSFTVPTTQIAVTSSSSLLFSSANGYGEVFQQALSTASTSSNFAFSPGSKITIAGAVSPHTQWNGSFQCKTNYQGNLAYFISLSGTDSYTPTAGTVTVSGYPGVMPFYNFGTDTVGITGNASLMFNLDFFAFIWNPAVNPSSALTPNSSLPRYW